MRIVKLSLKQANFIGVIVSMELVGVSNSDLGRKQIQMRVIRVSSFYLFNPTFRSRSVSVD